MHDIIQDKAFKIIIIVFILSIIFVMITLKFWIEISLFSIALLKAAIGILLFIILDKVGLKEIDTIDELKKGNIAYALFLLSLALLISASIISS